MVSFTTISSQINKIIAPSNANVTVVELGAREFFKPATLLKEARPLVEEISSKSNVHVHGICIGAYLIAMTTISASNDGIQLDSITSIIWVG